MGMIIEAIQKLDSSTTPKGYNGFANVAYFLSKFFSWTTEVTKIYIGSNKKNIFQWRSEQEVFEGN